MSSLYSVIDLAQLGLGFERLSIKVAAENIANVNNASYIPKQVVRASFLEAIASDDRAFAVVDSTSDSEWIVENPSVDIRLDDEVFDLSTSEMRYQALAEMLRAKFSLMELAMGVKGK
jgi:flagellar basal body rod protein FlgB